MNKVLALLLVLAVLTACASPTPEIVEKEVVVEKPVVQTVVIEKEKVVEKPVVETVVVEKEKVVEKPVVETVVVEKKVVETVEVEKIVKETVVVEKVVTPEGPKLGRELIGEYEGPEIITDPTQFPTEFNEAPELAALVATGELPPVEERLPVREDLLVFEPLHETGTYGGVWRRGFTGPGDGWNSYRAASGTDFPLFRDETFTEVVPNVAKGWEVSEDGRVIDLFLRRGMRWSDGEPFTADDWMFWYEDILNEPAFGRGYGYLETEGGPGVMEKIDDYQVRFTFVDPYPFFLQILSTAYGQSSSSGTDGLYQPKHYLSQFHAKYVGEEEANRKAKEAGFDTWVQLFQARGTWTKNPDLPAVTPWLQVIPNTEPVWILERNPYYFAVDTEGNQLPYIDRIEMTLAPNLEVINLRAIAGDYDLQARHLDIAKLPIYLENQEKAGYKVYLDPGDYGSEFQIRVNQNYDLDPEIGKWLQDTDFRRALSLGIDRDQINDVFFLGMGVCGSPIPGPTNPYYPGDEYRTLWHTYEPDKANEMLDALGLDKKDSEGFRLRTDNGERLRLELLTESGMFVPYAQIGEMIQEQWVEIGIDLQIRDVERSFAETEQQAGRQQLFAFLNDNSVEVFRGSHYILPTAISAGNNAYGMKYGLWYVTEGEDGLEPPPRMKEALEMVRKGLTATDAERKEMGKEIWRIAVDECYAIGTVGLAPGGMALRVANVNMGNVPQRMDNSPYSRNPAIARPQTFFFKQ